MSRGCGCCECNRRLTPMSVANRPALPALLYRAGTHSTFLETMKGRLSSTAVPSLQALTTLDAADPAIAMLDAWATTADVLTFYNERFANEGYLRTASERRSVLELGRLVGYELRPGVAASAFLAYTMDENAVGDIPVGTRTQSVPLPGQKSQSFETIEPLHASWQWNLLRPRLSDPPRIKVEDAWTVKQLWFTGTTTNLKPQDPLLLVYSNEDLRQYVRLVKKATPDLVRNVTEVELQPVSVLAGALDKVVVDAIGKPSTPATAIPMLQMFRRTLRAEGAFLSRNQFLDLAGLAAEFLGETATSKGLFLTFVDKPPGEEPPQTAGSPTASSLGQIVTGLLRAKSKQPANSGRLSRSVAALLQPGTETRMQLLQASFPQLREQFEQAFANSLITPKALPLQEVYVLRRTALLFGSGAPKELTFPEPPPPGVPNNNVTVTGAVLPQQKDPAVTDADLIPDVLHLDRAYDGLTAGGWVVIRNEAAVAARITAAGTVGRNDYGINTETLRLELSQEWMPAILDKPNNKRVGTIDFRDIRRTIVFIQSEPLTLARIPRTITVGLEKESTTGESKTRLDLDSHCPGLTSGRRVILSGIRTDIAGTSGITGTELLMLAGVEQNTPPGETPYTTLLFANKGLAYEYRRDSVTIRANIAPATHGETKEETLGSGDASKPMQRFDLRSSPLTWVSAPTPSGVATTLSVRINKVRWDEIDSLAGAGPNAQRFTSRTGDDARTTVTFGNGREGSRVPTGANNVTAVYRVGIGREGNVATGQLTLLATRPLGVKEVINPISASGGADAETRDQARANVPVALQALDRLVSLRDYVNFSRTFAGIAKASAQRFPGGRRPRIHLTVAGDADNLIEETSDLHNNLVEALQLYGDPYLPTTVVLRDRITVMLSARVQLDPRYLWDTVEPAIRAALTAKFGFEQRDLGQALHPSEVVSAIQSVAGVVAVDLDDLRGLTATEVLPDAVLPTVKAEDRVQTIRPRLAHLDDDPNDSNDPKKKIVFPAQIAYITPEVADTVVLKEIKVK
jgi:hypothetical protein